MQYSKLGSINYPKYCTQKPWLRQSQSLALAFGLAWSFSKPRPPQAKPKPLAFRPSQARTSLSVGDSNLCWLDGTYGWMVETLFSSLLFFEGGAGPLKLPLMFVRRRPE